MADDGISIPPLPEPNDDLDAARGIIAAIAFGLLLIVGIAALYRLIEKCAL